jgi:hypothetical protein
MPPPALESLPGFRRRFRVTPSPSWVRSEVEDDYHCMSVTIHHDGRTATRLEPVQTRAPWTTCPGAVDQLKQTFTGIALEAFASRGEKQANCTHLHDLAILAAAHAFDQKTQVYDILVSDPIDGRRRAELRKDGLTVLGWVEADFRILEPAEMAGMTLDKLRPWIDALDPARQEAARLLRWGNMIANGRTIPMERQSDATRMPPNCYTFTPPRRDVAIRIGEIRDFSSGTEQPLEKSEAAMRS